MKPTLLLLLAPFLVSCKLLSAFDRVEPRPVVRTPNGAEVLTPLPAWREGQQDAQVLEWVDARIAQWVASHPERSPAELLELAHKYTYKLIDHFRFPAPLASTTGYAEGQIFYSTGYILVCLYTKAQAVEKPATVPYPWMIEQRDGLWKWGVFPSNGIGFAVIPHELEHTLKGHFHD